MPLQIRRGTELERSNMTVPLAAGELLYVSDEQRIYVGNGSTVGGIPVTGYTNEDAQDAAAGLFTSGTHSGISFTYVDGSNKINATIDLTLYSGPVKGDLTGSVFADSSTRLIDGTNGKFNLDGTINTDVIPSANITYSLGSSSNRFKDLYLSGSSIYLGDAVISATGSAVNLPAGSLINGQPIGVPGGDLNVNIVADDSTVMVNTVTEVITAQGGFVGNLIGVITGQAGSVLVGNTTGYHTGDVKGSVVADDSTILVDGLSGRLSNGLLSFESETISSNSQNISIGKVDAIAGTSLTFNQIDDTDSLHIKNTAGDLGAISKVSFNAYKGSIGNPIEPIAGDYIGVFSYSSYSPAISSGLPTAIIAAKNDPLGTHNTQAADGKIEIITASTAGGITLRYLTFDRLGQLAVNQETAQATVDINGVMRLVKQTAAPSSPVEGMIAVADRTTWDPASKGSGGSYPVYYNGSTWTALF